MFISIIVDCYLYFSGIPAKLQGAFRVLSILFALHQAMRSFFGSFSRAPVMPAAELLLYGYPFLCGQYILPAGVSNISGDLLAAVILVIA